MVVEHLKINRHDRNFTDLEFKEKEISKYETSYPGLKIIKPHYRSHHELETDWKAFLALPYQLRIIADEKALFLFGKKNEELYKMVRSEFMKNDLANVSLFNNYKPANLQEMKTFLDIVNNVYIIKMNIKDLDTLNLAWEKYLGQDDNQKEIADSISFEYYNMTVPEVYNTLLKKLNVKNDNGFEYDFGNVYSPPKSTIEAFVNELDYILESTDIIEKIIFLNQMQNRANTAVLKTMTETLKENIEDKLKHEQNLHIFDVNYFLPQEIMELVEDVQDDKLFLNYAARFYGIKPYKGFLRESALNLNNAKTDTEKIKLGWNPVMEYNEENIIKAKQRCISILNDNINYNIIPLYGIKNINEENNKKGLSIVSIYETDNNHIVQDGVPKILISFDYLNEHWYQYAYSQIMTKLNINDVLNEYKEPLVECFFIEMDESLHKNYSHLISNFNTKENSLTRFTSLLKEAVPVVNNAKLFVCNFLNGLLESNGIYNSKCSIYYILNEFNSTYKDIVNAHKKLYIIEHFNEITHLDTYFNINILKEAETLPIEFDNDGNMFIKKKENIDFELEYSKCHKLLKQYEKVENYEAIKYYVAKLWYMNIILEKKIHQKNQNTKFQEELPRYYKARAHILNDFNFYMGKILENEPDFNFQEYYENTPFNQSVIKVSKNLLEKIWLMFKALIIG